LAAAIRYHGSGNMDLAGDFFSALRRMKTRGSVPEAAPNPALQTAEQQASPASGGVLPAIGRDGIALIKRFEGCARKRRDGQFEAYRLGRDRPRYRP
jgi:lysozyme